MERLNSLSCVLALLVGFSFPPMTAAQDASDVTQAREAAQVAWMLCTRDAAVRYSVLNEAADVVAHGALGKCAPQLSDFRAAVTAEYTASVGAADARERADAIVSKRVSIQRDALVSAVLETRLARRHTSGAAPQR